MAINTPVHSALYGSDCHSALQELLEERKYQHHRKYNHHYHDHSDGDGGRSIGIHSRKILGISDESLNASVHIYKNILEWIKLCVITVKIQKRWIPAVPIVEGLEQGNCHDDRLRHGCHYESEDLKMAGAVKLRRFYEGIRDGILKVVSEYHDEPS